VARVIETDGQIVVEKYNARFVNCPITRHISRCQNETSND